MTGPGRSGRARRLPFYVRVLQRQSGRGLPDPVCEVAVEQRIAVPAGDGAALLTDHYIPLADGPCPTLLVRSPYGRGFPWNSIYGARFAAQGFHVLIQSVRGTGGSGGTTDPWRQERADGGATMAWLREQDWFNGTLGAIGTSYLGYAAWALAADAPPELRAIVADGSVDPYPFFYGSGAFALQNVLAATVAVPVSLVIGWDDVQLDQTLEQYRRLREAGGDVRLIVGPWNHTSIFDKGYPVVFPRALEEFRARLSGEPGRPPGPPVRVHVGGTGQWRDLPEWPPPQVRARPWYLGADGALGEQPPAQAGLSSFRYDPSDPTPSTGGPVLSGTAGCVDNTRLEARPDVLTFTTAPLARLCDLDPDGRSRNICDGLIRQQGGQFDGETTITVPMSSTAYRFGAGHRIRLQVSGGAHPRYARNTGTSDPQATATRLVPADIEILHAPEAPCILTLPAAETHPSAAGRSSRPSFRPQPFP